MRICVMLGQGLGAVATSVVSGWILIVLGLEPAPFVVLDASSVDRGWPPVREVSGVVAGAAPAAVREVVGSVAAAAPAAVREVVGPVAAAAPAAVREVVGPVAAAAPAAVHEVVGPVDDAEQPPGRVPSGTRRHGAPLRAVAGNVRPGPAFDCRVASTFAEHRICASPALAVADRELDRLYRARLRASTRSHAARLRDEQHRWLGTREREFARRCRRHEGVDEGCALAVYGERIRALGARRQPFVPTRVGTKPVRN